MLVFRLGSPDLIADTHTLVESDIAFNLTGRFFRLGIVPGCVPVDLAINDDVIIAGKSFPGTSGVMIAFH